jgi:hypothetical protein
MKVKNFTMMFGDICIGDIQILSSESFECTGTIVLADPIRELNDLWNFIELNDLSVFYQDSKFLNDEKWYLLDGNNRKNIYFPMVFSDNTISFRWRAS